MSHRSPHAPLELLRGPGREHQRWVLVSANQPSTRRHSREQPLGPHALVTECWHVCGVQEQALPCTPQTCRMHARMWKQACQALHCGRAPAMLLATAQAAVQAKGQAPNKKGLPQCFSQERSPRPTWHVPCAAT
jgi:hypothetical protein